MQHGWKPVCYKTAMNQKGGMLMKRVWVPLCLILGFVMLAHSLYFWGGLASTEEVGSLVRERASTFSFIAWCYITAGQGLLDMSGYQESAALYAQGQVGSLFATMNENAYTALSHLFKEVPAIIKVSYYGGPLMILFGAFAHLRKPKPFKTFG